LSNSVFHFKQFVVRQELSAMKVGTDSVMLGAWADVDGCHEILDIGTGTGVIALMLAQRNELSIIHGVEIDEAAVEEAEFNFTQSPFSDRMRSFKYPIQRFAEDTVQRYDLIVCNPPFFTGGILSAQQDRAAVRHTIKLPHDELLIAVRTLLKPAGKFSLVLPYLEGLRFKEIAQMSGLYCNKVTGVKPSPLEAVERMLMQFSRKPKEYQYNEISIRNVDLNNYTTEYKTLTSEFYL